MELAIGLGASEEELERFGRFRSKMPLHALAATARSDDRIIQKSLEHILTSTGHAKASKVLSAGEIRERIAHLNDSDLVVLGIDEDNVLLLEKLDFLQE